MLNLDDVKKRLECNPEDKEITETRELIRNSFSKLEFVEDVHKYFLPQTDGSKIELPSVSATIEQWIPYVDWDEKCEIKAAKLGIPKEELKKQWHENNIISTSCGSKTHFFGENAMNMFIGRENLTKKNMSFQYTEDGYLIPYCGKEWAITKYYEDILSNPNVYPVMPEAMIYTNYNEKYKLRQAYAGTFDILLAYRYKGKIEYAIHDFKGLPLDTPILTKDGFKTMGELKVGDIVYDKNGKYTTVINCSEVHHNPCMKILFDDKYSIVCDYEHRWEISFLKGYSLVSCVMTTQELYDYVHKLNNSKRRSDLIPKIVSNNALEGERGNLPIDPYVLGVWLGDGHSASGYVTNMYDGIFDEIERRGYKVGENVDRTHHCGKAKTRCIFGLSKQLKENGLIKNKHIPDIFIINSSFEQRLDLLRGIMDTDGYYNHVRNRFVLTTSRLKQAEFCIKILTSLGIKPTLATATGTCSNCKNRKLFKRWDVTFSTDIYPFLIRNVKVHKVGNTKHKYRNIVDVVKVDTVPTRCIEVDSPTHTYLADKMLLVTHNTNKDLYKSYSRDNGIMMLEPFGSMGFYEEAWSHYAIQLSLYSIGLMQLGIKPIDRVLIWLKDDGTYEKVKVPDLTDKLLEILT